MSVLFVNACLRGEESRTLKLCRAYLDGVEDVEEVDLAALRLAPMYAEEVDRRAALQSKGDFSDLIFDLSKQFAAADEIVIGAPYWDLSFPAALKAYIERVSVCDIAFCYTEQAECVGKCRASKLTYITTCGGSVNGANLGYEYFCGIAKMFGIPETRFVAAENLDVWGCDIEAEMNRALEQIARLKAEG